MKESNHLFCSKNASTNGTVVADEIRCPEKLIVKGGKLVAWTCLPSNFVVQQVLYKIKIQ